MIQDFNTSYVTVQHISAIDGLPPPGISIHLMLRFNKKARWYLEKAIKFQYILCYGSTVFNRNFSHRKSHFNTSYVTVQPNLKPKTNSSKKFQYILCYGSTFKKTIGIRTPQEFQYILCYGSTTLRF